MARQRLRDLAPDLVVADWTIYERIDPNDPGNTGPIGFIRHVIGLPVAGFDEYPGNSAPFIWQHQVDIITSVWTYQRTSVSSCHSIGKDFTAALIALVFLQVFEPSIVVTTGPTDRQVKLLLWGEIASHYNRSRKQLRGHLNTAELKIAPLHYAIGFKTKDQDPERFAGFHSPHILYVIDEASGVPDPIYEAIEGGMASGDARLIEIGNPLEAGGQFYQHHHSERSTYNCIEIGYADTPNYAGRNEDGSWVVPAPGEEVKARYFILPSWAEEMRLKWSEDNPLYQARVQGRFPTEGVNTLISMLHVIRAIEAPLDRHLPPSFPARMGVDAARYGDDETAIHILRGRNHVHHEQWTKRDGTFSGDMCARLINEHGVKTVRVDVVGIGSGIFDRLTYLQDEGLIPADVRLVPINVAEMPSRAQAFKAQGIAYKDPEFELLRDEVWWNLREVLRQEMLVGLPHDEVLMGQLCGIMYSLKTMRLVVEKKEDMKLRMGGSPDRAEALMLAAISDEMPLEQDEGDTKAWDGMPDTAVYAGNLWEKEL